jgi:phosphatidylglycerophosphate synthase
MIDRFLLPFQHRMLAPPARLLAARGVMADQVTLTGLALGAMAALLIALGVPGPGAVLLMLNRLADGLDGALARAIGPTDRGAFLDSAADFLFYASVPLAFALADPARNALPAAALLAAFLGTGSTFLAFAALAARRGMVATDYPLKGLYYLGGLTEGTETILVFLAMAIWPAWFPTLAWVFAALCLITTASRIRLGWLAFSTTRTSKDE